MPTRKILIRFDDVCPTMNWKLWEKAIQLLNSIHVTALVGVIPDCKDLSLQIDAPVDDFWDYLKHLQQQGFTIAMHGFNHIFSTTADGIVTKNKISEFAGLPYEKQLEKIQTGKAILNEHGIDTDVFFAPAHSYDDNTLRALASCGFRYISDGYSTRPYIRHGITCLPCPNGGIPKIKKRGYYTAVIHTHEWILPQKSQDWNRLQHLCEYYQNDIVSFQEFSKWTIGYAPIQRFIEKLNLCCNRYIIPFLVRIKHAIVQ